MTETDSKKDETNDEQEKICPLTLEELPNNPLDVGYVWNSTLFQLSCSSKTKKDSAECGHKCHLLSLIKYLEDDNNKSGVLDASPVISVSDGIVATQLMNMAATSVTNDCEGSNTNNQRYEHDWDIVSFRYGKRFYGLAVGGPPESIFSRSSHHTKTAQGRICHALGLEEKSLKVLSKGKVLYPNPKLSAETVSSQLLHISSTDFNQKKNKPSLVVMGTMIGRELRDLSQNVDSIHNGAWWRRRYGGIFGWLRWMLGGMLYGTRGVLGGVFLFFRSVLFPPARNEDTRDD